MRGRSTSKALYVWLVMVLLLSTFPSTMLPDLDIEFSDLFVHFILYAITGALFYVVFRESRFKILNRAPALNAIALAAAYGFGMEVAQFYIPGRSFSYADALANALGAMAAVSLLAQKMRSKKPADEEVDHGD